MGEAASFSTDRVPTLDRVEAWSEFFAVSQVRVEVRTPDSSRFRAAAMRHLLGAMQLVAFELGPVSLVRTRELLRDQDDSVSFVVCTAGRFDGVLADGSEALLLPGQAALLRHDVMVGTVATGGVSGLTLQIPRRLMLPISDAIDRAGPTPSPSDPNALGLLASYIVDVEGRASLLSPQLAASVQGHVLDLLACAYDPAGAWARAQPSDGRRAALRGQILGTIAKRATDAACRPASVAAEVGISPRQLHLLLEKTGRTFGEHLRERRLQAARQMLASPRFVGVRVAEIAFAAGFSDLSYFNRRFRRRFGDVPQAFRVGGRVGAPGEGTDP